MKPTVGTITRTIVLALGLVNMILMFAGKLALEIDDNTIYEAVSLCWVIASAVISWWKNNSFTKKAIEADEAKDEE